ncbi:MULTISPECIES: VOC family protein [Clostridium]|uniref:VOC family protein n=1 Tax=Clostridium TaxID=1485 RepID=UPI0003D66208|nr:MULTISPECIES: VOC family protein [Clostridium]ETI91948.1 MAG: Glyoxalase family protein [Clostridium butyricum DORA_1]KQB78389.1 glyoxalase [Clostridium butyricum]MDB2138360.1 VOC family protein [Clostridium butyricum]MDB2157462.1 VOC family protein [Clostridium butyricum]MDB2160887.1 VOC family protein [Clostridium butyricum]
MSKKIIHHVCIQTNDYKNSLDFYNQILDFEIVQETKNFHNRDYNTWLKCGDFMIELQTPKNNIPLNNYSTLNEGIVHMCFFVDNIHSEYEKIKSCGYTKFKLKNNKEIYKVENGFLFKVIAPEGTEIEFRDSQI